MDELPEPDNIYAMLTVKFIDKKIKEKFCLICRGQGHYAFECSTKKVIDKQAKRLRIAVEWGYVKSQIMMNNYHQRNVEFAKLMRPDVIPSLEYEPPEWRALLDAQIAGAQQQGGGERQA